jgi:hypothetical protein
MLSVQPEDLRKALKVSFFACLDGSGVIPSGLGASEPAPDSPHIFILYFDADGSKAFRIICSRGRADYEVDIVFRGVYTEAFIVPDHSRTKVQ